MLIDWFTVVAQIVNFLILVALLKHFFYDRIIRAMEKREERIQNRLREAEQREKDAEQEAESYRDKQAEIEHQRREKLEQAKAAAEEERKKLTQNARREVDTLQKKWKTGIQKEKDAFVRDFRLMAAREVFAVSRKALGDLANIEIEERVSGVFLERMKEMKKEDLKDMAQSLQEGDDLAAVRSGFEISEQMRQKITEAVHRHISEEVEVEFQTAPELLLGIELKTGGRKLDWSMDAYLTDLEEAALNLLDSVESSPDAVTA